MLNQEIRNLALSDQISDTVFSEKIDFEQNAAVDLRRFIKLY